MEKIKDKSENINYNFVKVDAKILNIESKLLLKMESLSRELNDNIEYINECKEKGLDYSINELGIVQMQGNTIDILCSKLMTLKEIKKELEE